MLKKIQMRTKNGLTEAHKIAERDFAIVPGTDDLILSGPLGVSRGGMFKELGLLEQVIDIPSHGFYDYFETENGLIKANVKAAVALAWLTSEQRDEIRATVPLGTHHSDSAIIEPIVEKYNVNKHAILYVSITPEDKILVLEPHLKSKNSEGEIRKLVSVSIDDYKKSLWESARPPSRGGNTKALHRHSMEINGDWYSFFALGAQQWAFKGDILKFDYILTPKGYRNVIKNSVSATDKKGNLVHRGNRGFKKQLRSTFR